MALFSLDILRKVSKWTDDIKRDTRFYGVGYVNKQIQYPNGSRVDQQNEDRPFSYELKENEIFAYGVIHGYNGNWTVDIVEQCLLSNIYFDHLNSLQEKNDDQVYEMLREEFSKTEQTLRENINDLLIQRTSKTILNSELRKGTQEYYENRREINEIDKKIDSGAFATISLIIDDRLFVANIGNVHCFVCSYDKRTLEKRVTTLETVHTLNNVGEMLRLIELKADIQDAILKADRFDDNGDLITYTRCLGDFKHKLFYHENHEFRDCMGPPILSEPDHPKSSLKINDTFLFMAMYTDGLVKTIRKTHMASENVNALIAKMLLRKIVSEQTLNSAAQSALDEVKRAYDDKQMSTYNERDDFTLIVRVFDPNIKNKLIAIENQNFKRSQLPSSTNSLVGHDNGSTTNNAVAAAATATASASVPDNQTASFIEYDDDEGYDDDGSNHMSRTMSASRQHSSDDALDESLISTSINSTASSTTTKRNNATMSFIETKIKREDLPKEELHDADGRVIAYVDLDQLDKIVNADENRDIFDDFIDELKALDIDRI